MRSFTIIDICILLLMGLFFNTLLPKTGIAPDFLLAAFIVMIIPKHNWKLGLFAGAILIAYTVVRSGFSLAVLLQVGFTGIIAYFLAGFLRKHIADQGLLTGVICSAGGIAGGWVGSLYSGMIFMHVVSWALLTTLVAYTFYVSLDYGERIFDAQYRKSQV